MSYMGATLYIYSYAKLNRLQCIYSCQLQSCITLLLLSVLGTHINAIRSLVAVSNCVVVDQSGYYIWKKRSVYQH